MPNLRRGKLLSLIMAGDDDSFSAGPAPLPRHERSWRHPSEIDQHRRAPSRRAAPPLSPLVAALCGGLGLGLIVALVALVVPRDGVRESAITVRNAAISGEPSETATQQNGAETTNLFSADGSRVVLRVAGSPAARSLFVTTLGTPPTASLVVETGVGRISLTPVAHDDESGLSFFTTDAALPTAMELDPSSIDHAADPPVPGTGVVVHGRSDVSAKVGIAVASNTRLFVPLSGIDADGDIPDAAIVESSDGEVLGIFTRHDDAHGYIPLGAIDAVHKRLP